MPIAIGVVGVGKIARDQHLPAIMRDHRFRLAGVVSRHAEGLDVPIARTLSELKALVPELDAVAVCTPPVDRAALLEEAFAIGLDVLMEKPPAATLSEAERFIPLAAGSTNILYQSWHSRAAPAVQPAREWLAGRSVRHVRIDWLEDVRVWHPGQEWMWNPGVGVFDPGINALSILTCLIEAPLQVRECVLEMPANRPAPIACTLALAGRAFGVDARFSIDQRGPQTWTIRVEADAGLLTLEQGGARWAVDGCAQPVGDDRPEYARVYDHFAELVSTRTNDIDLAPFRLVADAFLLGRRRETAPFDW